MTEEVSLSSVLACPRCGRGPVTLGRAGWMCDACSSGYPVIGDIAWLFADPRQSLAEWRGRLGMLAEHLAAEAAAMRAAVPAAAVDATRRRLEHVAAAYEDQIARLKALLAPLGIEPGASPATHQGLGTKLPLQQGLTNYYVNLHRDWCWGDDENARGLDEVRAALGGSLAGLGRTLVHGAGAGRLAYDLHAGGDASLTVATDFNPLLLFVARELFAGRGVGLWEFPIAPRGIEDHAVLRELTAPPRPRPGLELVAADALQPPFADGAFDTVVTPWFVDIIGEPFARVAARVNLLLKPGGRWINTGSLAFSRAAHADRVGLDEVLELMPRAGFSTPAVRTATLPYMRSPSSRHSRLEEVVTWVATKSGAPTESPRARVVPDWLLNAEKPVPRTPAFEMQAISSRVHAFMLALINGERSMRDMARVLADQRLLPPNESEAAVRAFLTRLHEETDTL
ncbi:MAG TPA: methyltransferase domain-containing protein [Steroidobacteraceae bacterium]|nr:methyltransferase domain-containing protein [Steroidobacteraceae bacterium]